MMSVCKSHSSRAFGFLARNWVKDRPLAAMGQLKLFVFSLAVLLSVGNGLYFHISETEEKCFIEEVPAETMIVGNVFQT